MKNLSDIEIIESVKKGNTSDYSIIINRYKDKAFSLLKRMLKNEMDAEEALMDSFMKAYKNLSSFRNEAKFSTWFYSIVYNTGISIINSKRRRLENGHDSIDEHFNLADIDSNSFTKIKEVKEIVYKCVDLLPPRYSVVLILFYIDNLSLNEIRDVLGISA